MCAYIHIYACLPRIMYASNTPARDRYVCRSVKKTVEGYKYSLFGGTSNGEGGGYVALLLFFYTRLHVGTLLLLYAYRAVKARICQSERRYILSAEDNGAQVRDETGKHN